MKERLTRVQQKVLDFIQQEVRSKGYPPSVREICNGVGLRSTSTVFVHLNNLQELGYIRRDPSKPRAIELLTEEPIAPLTPPAQNVTMVPIVGEIAAGQPILAEEAIDGYLPMATEMVDNGTYFYLRVKGDSMMNVGIYNRDYILVEQKNTADNGEIVVALLDDSATVKTFYKEDGRVRLQPENDAMSPIYADFVEILGKVRAVFRRI